MTKPELMVEFEAAVRRAGVDVARVIHVEIVSRRLGPDELTSMVRIAIDELQNYLTSAGVEEPDVAAACNWMWKSICREGARLASTMPFEAGHA